MVHPASPVRSVGPTGHAPTRQMWGGRSILYNFSFARRRRHRATDAHTCVSVRTPRPSKRRKHVMPCRAVRSPPSDRPTVGRNRARDRREGHCYFFSPHPQPPTCTHACVFKSIRSLYNQIHSLAPFKTLPTRVMKVRSWEKLFPHSPWTSMNHKQYVL